MDPLSGLNTYQRYVVEEFADEYRDDHLSRRELLRKVVYVTGSVPLAASVLVALGCGGGDGGSESSPAAQASATQPAPTAPPASEPGVTVQPSDPAIRVEEVSFRGPASDIKAYLARPSAAGSFPAVVVIHENRGLVEHIKDVARRYAKENFVGLAVDLISRKGGTGPDVAANTAALSREISADDQVADLLASVAYLKQHAFVEAGALGVTGFCYGGGYTWELAVASKDIKAAAPYYGTASRVMTRLSETQAAVLAIYGGNDARITSESPQVEEQLKAAGKTYEIKVYPGANHAFFNDTGASYNEAAAKDAWQMTLAWFRRYLAG